MKPFQNTSDVIRNSSDIIPNKSEVIYKITKGIDNHQIINAFYSVGMTGFEPATTRPPDAYSNRAELHPVFI